jgi:ribosomal protein S4
MTFRRLKRIASGYLHQPFPENLFPSQKVSKKKRASFEKLHRVNPMFDLSRLVKQKGVVSFGRREEGECRSPLWREVERDQNTLQMGQSVQKGEKLGRGEALSNLPPLFDGELFLTASSRSQKGPKMKSYKAQLFERKKLSLLYGNLSKKTIEKTIQKASRQSGLFHERLFSLFESRLDVVLFRSGFFHTLLGARDWIRQKRISVNGQKVDVPSLALKPGDVVTLLPQAKQILASRLAREFGEENPLFFLTQRESFCLFDDSINQQAEANRQTRRDSIQSASGVDSPFFLFHHLTSELDSPKVLASPEGGGGFHRFPQMGLSQKCVRVSSFPLKPTHLEISYSRLVILFLFPPQKLIFPAYLALQRIKRSLS